METKIIEKQFCPICFSEVQPYERYPNYVCANCSEKAVSEDGRPLEFYNETLTGGFLAFYADTKEKYDSHICYIEKEKCVANEAYLGGIVIQTSRPGLFNKLKGGFFGLLIGDALGVPYEFHAREEIPLFDEIEFQPPVGFRRAHAGVPIGTWSDDGAQALILLNTLLECGKFDAAHFAEGLVSWYDKGFMAVGGKVFDVGIQTANAIRELKRGVSPLLAGGTDEYSNGNGSLMRVLPLALWHRGSDEDLIKDAFDQSAVTHGHLRSKICCAIYCLWARQILRNSENAWERAVEIFKQFFPDNTIERIEFETRIFPTDATFDIKGGGYVVDSLRAAQWLNNENQNYETVVKSAIALGDDTDTTACIAGGIAGINFGITLIPKRWRDNLQGKEIYKPLLEKLLQHYLNTK